MSFVPSPEVFKKIAGWQERLLDFTRRNPLLSLPAKSLIEITDPPFTPDELFSRLTGGTKTAQNALTFLRDTVPPEEDFNDETNGTNKEDKTEKAPPSPPRHALKAGQKEVSETEYKLLGTLRNKARLSLTEQGINILFITRGTLQWLDPKTNTVTRSPLLLVPVELEKLPPASGDGFVLRRFDDDVRVNPTLRSRLAQADIGFALPDIADEDAVDAPAYLAEVQNTLLKTPRTASWEVLTDECFLGRFSFLKLVMYEDLAKQTEAAASHPIIAALAGQTEALHFLPEISVPDAEHLDDLPAENSLMVLPADPSQERAVLAARQGQSFVLQGPPGTGKTQTIANLLAACIADGKRVLFVSEKMAALDAVYKRLHGAGLGDLCLEAHSHKAGKKDVLASLGKSLAAAAPKNARDTFREADELNTVQNQLNQTVAELHKIREPLGISLYEAFGHLAQMPPLPFLPFVLGSVENVGGDALRQRERLAEQLAGFHDLFTQAETHPWRDVKETRFSSDLQNRLRAGLTDLLWLSQTLKNQTQILNERCGLPPVPEPASKNSAYGETIAELLAKTPCPPPSWLQNQADLSELRDAAQEARDKWRGCERRRENVEAVYAPTFFGLPHEELASRLTTRHDALLRPALGAAWAEGTPAFYAALGETLQRVQETCVRVMGSGAALAALCGLPAPQTLSAVRFAAQVAACARPDPRPLSAWFSENGQTLPTLMIFARDAHAHQTQHDRQKAELTNAGYLSALFALDVPGLLSRFTAEYAGVFRFIKPAYWRDMGTLKQVMGAGGTLKDRNIVADLQTAQEANAHQSWLQSNETELRRAFGNHYQNAQTDWEAVLTALQQTQAVCALFPQGVPHVLQARLSASGQEMQTLLEQAELMARHLSDGETELGSRGELSAHAALPQKDTTPIVQVPLGQIAEWCGKMRASAADFADARATVLAARSSNPFDADGEPPPASRLLADDLVQTQMLLLEEAALNEEAQRLRERFARFFAEHDTDWEKLLDALLWTEDLRRALFSGGQLYKNDALPDALLEAACDPSPEQTAQISQALVSLRDVRQKAAACWHDLSGLLHLDVPTEGTAVFNTTFSAQAVWAQERITKIGELERFLQFMQNKAACQRVGMTSFWEVITRRSPPEGAIAPAFQDAFYKRFVESVGQTVPGLQAFSGRDHNALRETFARLDCALLDAAPARIRAKTNARKSRLNGIGSDLGEVGKLKALFGKSKLPPVRKIFSAIPTILGLLKPCLLMSPLSVSMFLDADRITFDVVVFDEASQIFTESAIGSLLRAKQAIIAGDTKQLPPTAFFKGLSDGDGNDADGNDDDDGISDGGEFESVLSAASACANDNRFASHPLLWHYRSRHESLIGFSREHFYEHLQTFPSAAVPSALQFDYVENGVYHGGVGNRRDNPIEAAHVAQKVAEQICTYPKQSVGVITMSEAQQNAVYAAVEKLKRNNNRLAALLNEDGPEGFFVKNIENVQGDERDVIFLSIGYGRDAKTGVFRLNFGPLNKEGGERRLNVAVTRARLRCVTVASFLPSEIDPARTDKSGPLLLRAYMERAQAQNGASSISQEAMANAPCPADGFVQAVCAALQKRGYLVQQNVGLFDFRVDIGVLDDANTDRFLLGILCDGAHYLSGETARAREYLRDDVLRGLEWRLVRIWSADFARNPEAVLQTIEQAVARAKSGVPEPGSAPAKAQGETVAAPAEQEETTETLHNSEAEPAENAVQNTPEPLTDRDALLPGISHFVPVPEGELTDFARAFWNAEAENQATLLTDFVHAEGPVLFAAAAQKIAGAAGFARTGNRLQQTVRDAAGLAASRGEIMESDGFLWPAGLINAPPARVPAPGDTPRPIEALALEEIGAVMTALLQSAIGMSQNEAIENTARLLGYARTGPTVRERITSALSLLELSHHVHVQGGQVYTFEPNG